MCALVFVHASYILLEYAVSDIRLIVGYAVENKRRRKTIPTINY